MTKAAIDTMRNSLEERLQTPISDWAEFAGLFSLRTLRAGEPWVSAGEMCSHFCFIASGLMRVFYIDQHGHEVNEGFYPQGDLLGPISALLSGTPCQYFMEALEASELLVADYHQFHRLGYDRPEWLRFEIKLLQQLYLRAVRRDAKLLLGGAEQRYRWFCREYPDLVNRIPQYQIASYLGVTPVTLSRIRSKG